MIEINKIYNMDCLEGLKQLKDNSIDCIWTDPPFNINYIYDEYKDSLSEDEYFKWCEKWLIESYRVIKSSGSIYIKIWSHKSYELQSIMRSIGFKFQNQIIWKRKSQAGYKNKLLGGYEVILFFTKSKDNYIFNPEAVLRKTEFLARWDGTKIYKGRLNDLWDDIKPVTAGNLKHPEGIYIKGTGKKEHPAQHPEELVRRCILFSTYENHLILDLFMGSGTTASVCVKNNRKYIGFDISNNYVNIAKERLFNI